MATSSLRTIPAVEKLLQALGPSALPRPMIVRVVRRELAALRRSKRVPSREEVLRRVTAALEDLERSRLRPVINATGILIHTNLGRAPLGNRVIEELRAAGTQYTNLELDLAGGGRGQRAGYLEACLAVLCQSEAATVVNNCAAALLLILRYAVKTKPEVIISRGELVQIGGGFRIPEILEASGAVLREVGTTNRTTLEDYEKALGASTAMILKVHRSNFFMDGFVESVDTTELAALVRKRRVLLVEDLGSGALVATEQFEGVEHEPTPPELLRRGVDLVCFSGDKLMGGPQAGIIAGRARLVSGLKREPFFRALRCDKLILASLQAIAEQYLSLPTARASSRKNSAPAPVDIPVLDMLGVSVASLEQRAAHICQTLAGHPVTATVGRGRAQVGGGSLPKTNLRSVTVDLLPATDTVQSLAARLRHGSPPVIGYVAGGRLKLDLRSVFPKQDEVLITALRAAMSPTPR